MHDMHGNTLKVGDSIVWGHRRVHSKAIELMHGTVVRVSEHSVTANCEQDHHLHVLHKERNILWLDNVNGV